MSARQESGTAVNAVDADAPSRGPFKASADFFREVIAELKKVVIPTKGEMASYTVTVLGFVFAMIAIVFGLDLAFAWLANLAFAGGGAGS